MIKRMDEYKKERLSWQKIPRLNFEYSPTRGLWCPELIEKHRYPNYRAEVVFGKRTEDLTWPESELINLSQRVHCETCYRKILLHSGEREVLEKALAINLDFLDEMGEPNIGLVVKRGVIAELYYGIEYDEIGNSVSNNYYGHGSDLAHSERIVYSHLEIVTFLRNILSDNESSPEQVFEKRRYVQSIVEHFDSLEIFCDPKMEAHKPADLAMQKNRIYENSWSLGFLIAEYKNRFPLEAAMEKGLEHAKQTRRNDGSKRRKATVRRANQILREHKELIANLPALAKIIEAEKLTEHKQKTGFHIGWQAIAAQLREALKKGLLKNS